MENKYAPFTDEEFAIVKAEAEVLGDYLPGNADAQAKLWENCTRIRGVRENKPCACGKSAGLWTKCIKDIKDFVSQRS